MTDRISRRSLWLATIICLSPVASQNVNATIVEFQTVIGNFEVNLYDNATPATVANFLAYVNSNAYTNSVYHRSVPNFVVQGGGFFVDMDLPLDSIPTNPAVMNEPVFSNVRGTIAMAKLGGDPNSATSQWFFNLANNSVNLDGQNGGFTVFGEVVGNGMDVVDAIAALPTYALGGAFDNMPLRDYSATDFANSVDVEVANLVIVDAIIVTDSTVDSAAGLNPPANNANTGGGGPPLGGNGGGGSLNPWVIFMLLAMMLGRQAIRRGT